MNRGTVKKLTIITVGTLMVLLVGVHSYQRSHFNSNIRINNIPVGGLTVAQAYAKVRDTSRQSKIYLNHQLIYEGPSTTSEFTAADKPRIAKALQYQATFFPSHKRQNLLVEPAHLDKTALPEIDARIATQLNQMNANRTEPHDAYAVYQDGQVSLVPAVQGTQVSVQKLQETAAKDFVNGTVYLTPKPVTPLSVHSATVKHEQQQLNLLKHRSVTYQVQNTPYRFNTDQVISRATYQHGHYQFETKHIAGKINEINHRQATLGKAFKFKAHDGKEVTTSAAGTYGWKINRDKAGQTLAQALAHNTKQVNAAHDLEGKGSNRLGTGYDVTNNDGLGKTYVAVSLADQHAWFYKDGKCVLSTDIVSGTDNKNNETPKGVWYIMYQQTPSVLRGSNDDGSQYSSPVQYWSPFTLSGCGFHDASWRHDWSKNAYQKTNGGSHGCINMQPAVAGAGFHALTKGEPVIIY